MGGVTEIVIPATELGLSMGQRKVAGKVQWAVVLDASNSAEVLQKMEEATRKIRRIHESLHGPNEVLKNS